ncbi:MAG: ATP-binding protein [Oscillospiraceae bacterium]|nr:ATP-binding protein [Oscillospiraceae bacterium]
MDKLNNLKKRLNSLVIFRNLLENPLIKKLNEFLLTLHNNSEQSEKIDRYCAFVSELYSHGENLTEYVFKILSEDENSYVKKRGEGITAGIHETECLANELAVLNEVGKLSCEWLTDKIGFNDFLPKYQICDMDYSQLYAERLLKIRQIGFGVYSTNHIFVMGENDLEPVSYPDPIRLSQLSGYDEERQEVIENTLAHINGRPANNCLLYGDCGTGKSSTVKAIANEYKDLGLRLIEIKKKQLHLIPKIIEKIGRNPLKFILFIDDLSFSEDDDDYAALKAALEGSVSSNSPNMIIYATSNRRHLVKETFSSRQGDEIHFNDTVQEFMSLSERFGLTVTFMKPDKKLYLDIVKNLAVQYGIELDEKELFMKAEAFALSRSGRSPRCAKQFIEHLKGLEEYEM